MTTTRKEAVTLVQSTLATIALWESADSPNINWRGSVTKQMSESVELALKRMFQLCASTDVDDDAKEVIMAIDRVHAEFDAFEQAQLSSPESVHPTGTPELRSAIRVLASVLPERHYRLPEEIRDLMDSGVNDEQICRIYGFQNEDGVPDYGKLSQEKRKPGTHFDPETWVHPTEKRRQNEINELWRVRTPAKIETYETTQSERRLASETLQELIEQGVDADQIALMKGITVQDVEAYAMQNGLPMGGRTMRNRTPAADEKAKADLAQRRAELIPKSHPEVSDMEDRILACAIDKMKPVEIAEALQMDYPDLSWQKVSAIIRLLEKEGQQETGSGKDASLV